MLIGLVGRQGTGKTLGATCLGISIHEALGIPLRANYTINHPAVPGKLRTVKELLEFEQGMMILDELWLSMDSRMWKDNVALTRWINQTRKKNLITLYTTQHISQVDIRVRRATDWIIECKKLRTKEIVLTFVENFYGYIGKKMIIHNPSEWYPFYNTYEVLEPLTSNESRRF